MRHERGRPPYPELLTPAEQRVLVELRAGRQNAEIATRLGVSVNTVRYHVSNMLGKLGLANRAALRRWEGDAAGTRRGWLGITGLFGSRGASGAGVLAVSVAVGVVAAGLLVVGSGRVTVPTMGEEEPRAVTSEVMEPQDREVGAEVGSAVIYLNNGSVVTCVRINIDDVPFGSISPMTPGYLSDDGDAARLVDLYLPVMRVEGVGDDVGCRPIDLLKERSLADAFEVPVEED